MNLDKLKEVARRHELREEWRKAIDTYQRAIEDLARAGEPTDPSLHNRIGDLELKAGDTSAALTAYELAADTYADQGFYNNAIALCGKILRVNSGRTATFLRLAELHASKNVLAEARRNLLEFVERMGRAGQIPALANGVRQFSTRFARSAELRHLIAEALWSVKGSPETRATLEALAEELGVAEDGPRPSGGTPAASPREGWSSGGLVFLDTGVDIPVPGPSAGVVAPPPLAMEAEAANHVESLAFIEPTAVGSGSAPAGPPAMTGFEPTVYRVNREEIPAPSSIALEAVEAAPLEFPGLEVLPDFLDAASSDGLDLDLADVEAAEEVPLLDVGLEDHSARAVPAGEPLFEGLDVETNAPTARAPGRAQPQSDLSALPQDELTGLFARLEEESRWQEAFPALAEIQRRDPSRIPWYQKRVELAYRSGDRIQLVGAYLALAQALDQAGALENAALVYRRVIEHDPGNPVALEALENIGALSGVGADLPDSAVGEGDAEPATPAPAADDGFIDLGALILEPEPERDTRMRVDQGEPEAAEDVDFRETLAQFKQGIEANLDAGDFQAHYDLGIAFKEMGLLDEAIAQFQKALRSPEGRLKSSEALGVVFHDKGRHAIAEAVLKRAVESLPGSDEEKIGLIYWLGRTFEVQGRREDALRCYERALAVDILFLDVSDRVHHLAGRAP